MMSWPFPSLKNPASFTMLTANDTDPEHDPLKITSVYGISGGGFVQVDPQHPNTILFVPNHFKGQATFKYQITDGNKNTATATVTIIEPFFLYRGIYAGAISGQIPSNSNSGYFSLSVAPEGGFSGQLHLVGITYPLKGTFNATGGFTGDIVKPDLSRLKLTLQFPMTLQGQPIQGTLAGGPETLAFTLPFQNHSSRNPSKFTGQYTFQLPPPNSNSSTPQGVGVWRSPDQ